jgi:uncharacterized protein YjgD (DUF1641 family)
MWFKKQREEIMTLTELVAFFEEGSAVIADLKSSGVLDDLLKAESDAQAVLGNPDVQKLLTSVKAVAAKV